MSTPKPRGGPALLCRGSHEKEAPASPAKQRGHKDWIAQITYRVLDAVQPLFCRVCWVIEQRKSRLDTRIANEEIRDE